MAKVGLFHFEDFPFFETAYGQSSNFNFFLDLATLGATYVKEL